MGSRIKDNPERIFDVYMEVVHSGAAEPEVRRIFPDDYADQDTLQTVPKFCFPFSMDSVTVGQVGQNFTFVLTDVESKQRFGFCRLTYGAQSCSCILSYLPWFEVFYKLLNVLDDYTITGQESLRKELLECLHSSSIPVPGTTMYLNVHAIFTVPDPRKLPSIPENRNLTDYFVAVDVNNMLHLYASMLYERRILIISSKLSTLTACIHAAAAMLYPMYWQHVYIPVLPYHLIDYCGAPMPYLIGIHSSLIEKVQGMALDDVVVLNVDNNSLQTPFDDLHSLPSDVVSSLRSRLKKVSMTMGDGVARAFLKAQAALFGSYRNALHIEPEEPITFNEDAFITHRSSTMRQFLQNATQLQFFKEFIDGRLDLLNSGEGFGDVFEEEINMGEYAGSDRVYHQWLITFKKGGGALFNTVKTKANPAMRTVYKFAKDHAKIGIKEVKSRLKQKELTDNGYCSSRDEPSRNDLVSTHCKDVHTWEHRKPITVHLGKGLQNNLRMDNHHGQSLKDTDFKEEVKAGCLQSKTALSSPITTKFSELSLLENSFTNKQEKLTHNSLKQKAHAEFNSAWGLEDLSFICEPEEQQSNFKYQRMDLRGNEHRPESFLDEEHSNHTKILSQTEQDPGALYEQEFPCLNRPLSIPSLEPCVLNQESSKSTQHWTETRSITVSCPQRNNSAGPLAVKLPTVTPLQELTEDNGEVVVGRQDFHQALTVCPLTQSHSHNTETGIDLLCLLDPLSGAAEQSTPPLQSRPALPPFQPPVCLNSFTQVPHFYVHKCYGTVPPGNPFNPPYVYPQTAACFHTPPLLMFSQASHMTETQKNETWLADTAPPASISNSSLYSLLDSPPPPTLAQVLHPTQTVDNPNDPFSDLLTMATASTVMTTTSPQKMDELQRRWETFD